MIVKKSELLFQDFFIVESQFYAEPPNNDITWDELINNYPIDIDFEISERANNIARVTMAIHINREDEKTPGYKITVVGTGAFALDNQSSLSPIDKFDLLYSSSVQILIGSFRTYIASMTSFGPMGKYILPAVDLNDLVLRKFDSMKEKESKTKKPAKKRTVKKS
ncbi:MAG: hypothetical protein ACXWEY_11200 [Bacteroidia bacterium]